VVVDLEAGSVLPEHSHPHEQGGILLKGELEFTIGGETRHLSPGDVYLIPGGVEHSVRVGDSAAQLVDVFHPIREELQY
jgi:quercetin dioxygenase-like cupin family protein